MRHRQLGCDYVLGSPPGIWSGTRGLRGARIGAVVRMNSFINERAPPQQRQVVNVERRDAGGKSDEQLWTGMHQVSRRKLKRLGGVELRLATRPRNKVARQLKSPGDRICERRIDLRHASGSSTDILHPVAEKQGGHDGLIGCRTLVPLILVRITALRLKRAKPIRDRVPVGRVAKGDDGGRRLLRTPKQGGGGSHLAHDQCFGHVPIGNHLHQVGQEGQSFTRSAFVQRP